MFCFLSWLEYTWSLFSLIDPSIYYLSTCIKYIYIVVQMVNYLPATQETKVRSLGQEDLLEKEMATHSSILAWRIPGTEEPSGLPSMGSHRVGHD